MIEEQKQLILPGFEEVEPSGAAVARHYSEIGEQWESARETIALLGDSGVFVFNIQIRWPKLASKDVLLIVKVFTEEGSFVAFHGGPTWSHLITGFTARLRAGTINWIEDEFPPDEWADWYAVIKALPRVRR